MADGRGEAPGKTDLPWSRAQGGGGGNNHLEMDFRLMNLAPGLLLPVNTETPPPNFHPPVVTEACRAPSMEVLNSNWFL